MGSKHRPFYRVVVAESKAGRNGSFVENIGTYNPVAKPAAISIKEDRALHWLMNGAQPSETVAFILKKIGVLEKFFNERPNAKKKFSFLNKAISSISKPSSVEINDSAKAEETTEASTTV